MQNNIGFVEWFVVCGELAYLRFYTGRHYIDRTVAGSNPEILFITASWGEVGAF